MEVVPGGSAGALRRDRLTLDPRPCGRPGAYGCLVIAVGFLLMLIGFAFVVPRGGVAGSTAARNVRVGPGGLSPTPGYDDEPTRRYRVLQVVLGLVMMVGGFVILAVAT